MRGWKKPEELGWYNPVAFSPVFIAQLGLFNSSLCLFSINYSKCCGMASVIEELGLWAPKLSTFNLLWPNRCQCTRGIQEQLQKVSLFCMTAVALRLDLRRNSHPLGQLECPQGFFHCSLAMIIQGWVNRCNLLFWTSSWRLEGHL